MVGPYFLEWRGEWEVVDQFGELVLRTPSLSRARDMVEGRERLAAQILVGVVAVGLFFVLSKIAHKR